MRKANTRQPTFIKVQSGFAGAGYLSPSRLRRQPPRQRGPLDAEEAAEARANDGGREKDGAVSDERRIEQLKRLSGLLIDRLEQEVTAGEFSVKELRSYTNTLMDLRQIQMTDPRQIAQEQELKLIKLRREAGQLQPRQLRISFEGDTEKASG